MEKKLGRAYSALIIKAVDEGKRTITGVATTPTVDRMGDIVEPLGVNFKNPMPLLWQHKSDKPIGWAKFDKPTADGITFEAELPEVKEAGALRDRIEEAWQSIKIGLVKAVSIGFSAVEYAFLKDGGIHFQKVDVMELSVVTIPAQPDAVIYSVGKGIDLELVKRFDVGVAALGTAADTSKRPGASGISLKPTGNPTMKTLAEQLTSLENKRASNVAAMGAAMQKGIDEGRSSTTEEQQTFDTLNAELKTIDEDIDRLRILEKAQLAAARPVQQQAAAQPSQIIVPGQVKITPQLEKGVALARVVKCLGIAQGNYLQAYEYAKSAYSNHDAVVNVLKAAVAAGTTAHSTWAGPLVGDETSVFAEFLEWLRPTTILGRFGANGVPSLTRVPFRVPLISQTSGGAGYWVGEGKPKPLTKFDFARTTLEPLKVASIAVLTKEVIRDSSPSAETIIRDQLGQALRARLDTDFIDIAKAASAGVSPASITNGVTPITSTGNDAEAITEDIRQIFGAFIAANNAPTSGVWIMSATTALALSLIKNPLGAFEYPNITMNGGTFAGLPVIASQFVDGGMVVLANAADIFMADDGDVSVDMSNQASLQMDNAPATQDATSGTGTSLVSMFQTNSVAFLAERTINWMKGRASAVAVLDNVDWGQPAT